MTQSLPPGKAAGRAQEAARLTIQDLGNIGELIAALATVATLAYLAAQVRQNTRALRSSTFQELSMDMSLSARALERGTRQRKTAPDQCGAPTGSCEWR